jgi:hypothetical protein
MGFRMRTKFHNEKKTNTTEERKKNVLNTVLLLLFTCACADAQLIESSFVEGGVNIAALVPASSSFTSFSGGYASTVLTRWQQQVNEVHGGVTFQDNSTALVAPHRSTHRRRQPTALHRR